MINVKLETAQANEATTDEIIKFEETTVIINFDRRLTKLERRLAKLERAMKPAKVVESVYYRDGKPLRGKPRKE